MTAYWRSGENGKISGDTISGLLATEVGINAARQFENKYDYPLIGRKVSIRARFFLDNAVKLIKSDQYDSCISLASGFSLLTHLIYKNTQTDIKTIKFIDSDLPDIIEQRKLRLKKLYDNHWLPNLKSNIPKAFEI
jgi:O-methyltransferase involved in polyketide biosynthesis